MFMGFLVSGLLLTCASQPLLLQDLPTMQRMRVRAIKGDPALSMPLAALQVDAVALYIGNSTWVDGQGPWAVTDKVKWTRYVAASGNIHDYFSVAKYCWPCNTTCNRTMFPGNECATWFKGHDYHPHKCDNKTGLPWLCHDGFANPINADLDSGSWTEVANAVPTLALSAFLTDNADHAHRAVNLTRAWFLDPETAMRPNVAYAQAIPGINNGTHGGIIDWSDHHKLLDVLDGITLVSASPCAQVAAAWTADDERRMVSWVGEFGKWLQDSPAAKSERKSTNNHGTWFDVLAVGVFKFLGRDKDAGKICTDAPKKRLAKQVSGAAGGYPEGSLPLEDKRTNTEHYHSQNAAGLLTLAQLCRSINSTDLYSVSVRPEAGSGNVSLLDVVRFVLPYISNLTGPQQKWPFEEIEPDEPYYWAQVLRKAANGFRNATFERAFAALPQDPNIGLLQSQKYQLDLLQPFIGGASLSLESDAS
jgi:hypothetical protein